jgi:predicted nucleic acid-binding protein
LIVADTGALVALIDADDRYHGYMRDLYERDPDRWVVPWAVLPEVDYLVSTHVGDEAARHRHLGPAPFRSRGDPWATEALATRCGLTRP